MNKSRYKPQYSLIPEVLSSIGISGLSVIKFISVSVLGSSPGIVNAADNSKKAQAYVDHALRVEITHQILIFQDANHIYIISACTPF